MARDTDQENRPVIIKKYANRRLYNTDTSTYVTLEDLAEMVRSVRDFVVYDAKTGEDLTHSVLTQIIVEQESRGTNLLPIGFLRQLIRFYGDSMQRLVPSYLEFSLDSLTRQQEQYRRRFAHTFGTAAFEAMQEQVRKNFATFERALGLFSPFTGATPSESKNDHIPAASPKEPTAEAPRSDDEIANLKAELTAMKERLDEISRR
ncbi:polyhydroxyalkanoate synthesis repressor PhaR [Methyloceanibacter sp.]|uniref:polyhydroxyalkanoate synthesis repressor PhaR n=1 Tax=Methyloceanibacter sp. TaxID=1965321 RepID=UPI003D6CBFC2